MLTSHIQISYLRDLSWEARVVDELIVKEQATEVPAQGAVTPLAQVGVIVIGRNEGERLSRCLDSLDAVLSGDVKPIVYVDSGSSDGSCEHVKARQVDLVELALDQPFTAARARNAGFAYLREHYSDLVYVQMIDGDCQLDPNWLVAAVKALDAAPDVAAICGWRREQFPEQSVYNQICDIEWRAGSVGEISSCGGDLLVRVEAFAAVGGFNPNVIAGEEPELCMRWRQAGWKIVRLDLPMTRHDAQMTRFSQWWQRARRAGHAYAQVSALHGQLPEYGFIHEIRRVWLWGLIFPVLGLVLLWPTHGWSALLYGRYPLAAVRAAIPVKQQSWSWQASLSWGISCAMAPFAQVLGACQYQFNRWRGRELQIIEYKGGENSAQPAAAAQPSLGQESLGQEPLCLWQQIQEDWLAHGKDWTKPGFRAIAVYRFGVWRMGVEPKLLRAPLSVIYRSLFRFVRNVYGIELPYSAQLGRRVIIEHQGGIVIHGSSILGDDCIIRQGVTLGNRYIDRPLAAPKLGKRVNIGAGAKLLGDIVLGDDANVGANAVVLIDVPAGRTAVGIPAKLLPISDKFATQDY
jgi:serine acetyltransferase/GT2 family glycosyltransferase